MHTYRAAKIDDWREFLGITSKRHEHQSNYEVIPVARDHPAMKGFPEKWVTPKDELYIVDKMWPKTKPLAYSVSEKTGKKRRATITTFLVDIFFQTSRFFSFLG